MVNFFKRNDSESLRYDFKADFFNGIIEVSDDMESAKVIEVEPIAPEMPFKWDKGFENALLGFPFLKLKKAGFPDYYWYATH